MTGRSLSTPPAYAVSLKPKSWKPLLWVCSCWRWLSRLCSRLSQLCCWVGGADTAGALTSFFRSLLIVRVCQWVWYAVLSVARSVAFVLRWRSWMTNVAVLLVGWLWGGASNSGLPWRIGWSHSRSISTSDHTLIDFLPYRVLLPSPPIRGLGEFFLDKSLA